MATKKETAEAVEVVATETKKTTKKADTEKTTTKKASTAKKTTKKAKKADTITIKLVRGFAHRLDAQIATCKSLGLRHIGDVTTQPDNAATKGKLAKIAHMVEIIKEA